MNMAIPDILLNIDLKEETAYELVIENANMFGRIAEDLYSQINNKDGKIILSQDNREVSMAKHCEMIWNPFAIDFNSKKIVTSLYQEMQEISSSFYPEQENIVNRTIIEYLDNIINQMPYNLDYEYDLDKGGLYKLFKVEISEDSETIVERLIEYVKLLKKALDIEVIILVNVKQYLNRCDVEELYKSALYEKIKIMNIAGNETYSVPNEKRFLVDKDLCLIDLN